MFGINKKLRNQALIYGRTKGEIYVPRGENVLYLTTYTAKWNGKVEWHLLDLVILEI